MAASITTSSSVITNTNTNAAISKSTFTIPKTGAIVQNVTLTEIQNAVNKLSTYVQKVSNCKTIYSYTVKSTSCQKTVCQATSCQTTTCQSTSCQSATCQSCQGCQTCQSTRTYYSSKYYCSDGS